MKYEVNFLHSSYVNSPGSWLAVTGYIIKAKNEKEAIKKAIIRFKKRCQMKRFMKKDYQVTTMEIK